MMKKLVYAVACVVLLLLVINKMNTYERKGEVVAWRGSTVEVLDSTGVKWEVPTQGQALKRGDKVTLTMDSKGTSTIADDEVKKITKNS